MDNLPLTGLLLGAGASQEYGMPLLWDISRQIRVELSLPALRSENKLAQTVGRGFPDAVLEDFISVLQRPDMHYESIIGYLETNHLRNARSPDQPYHGLAAWLTEIIYDKIYNIHVQKSRNPDATVEYLDGLKKLTSKNLPLWVFSLNHDVVLESAAARLGLVVNSGFPGSASLPLPSPFGGETSIKVEVVTEEEMSNGLRFLQSGNEGINLIKLHGGIDIFTLRDGKDVLKLLPVGDHAGAMIHALFLANKVLPYRTPNNVNVINTIV
jgi:hypothetical protein